MAIVQAERRLAAIMVADVVGYSRLIEADEAATLAAIKDLRREVIDPRLAERHGRIVKLTGDGAIVEFGSVVDAVACAAVIQKDIAERQAEVSPTRRIVFRIAINLGDVVVDGDDLLGDGVNVAARLEQLCEPGGVLVSGTAYDHLQGRLSLPLEFVGEQRVKNIERPGRTWRVRLDGVRPSRWRTAAKRLGRRTRRAGAVALVALTFVGGAWWWFQPNQPASGPPSLAVLPFTNLNDDPTQDYLGAGVAEDIITMLSTFPTLRVISRVSSFTYDKPVKVQKVGQDLGVRYVLEGSVRKAADKVRVTAQLIDAETGDHVWANRFDEEAADAVSLQENVANQIYTSVAGLTGEIRKDEEQHSWSRSAPSLEEYDYYLRGHQLFFLFTPEDNERARQVWQEGLARFPGSALLRIKIAFSYLQPILSGWAKPSERDIDLAWRLGREAEAAQSKSRLETWLCHWLMTFLYAWHEEDFGRSVAEAEAAIQMVPYDAISRAALANYLANAGRLDEAIEWCKESMRRDPTGLEWGIGTLAWSYYLAGRYEEALAELQKMHEQPPLLQAAVEVGLGRVDRARAVVAGFLKNDPGYTLQDEARWPVKEPLKQAYLDDLSKAGLPEK